MSGKNLAYVRVSTLEQNIESQKEAIKSEESEIYKWFEDKTSGKNTDRDELHNLLDYAREGDKIYVLDFSRLARNTKDLIEIIDYCEGKGVGLVSVREKFDLKSPAGRLHAQMLASFYEFERTNARERQMIGIEKAKSEGKYKGRQKTPITALFLEGYIYIKKEIKTKTEVAKELEVSRPTLNRMIEDFEIVVPLAEGFTNDLKKDADMVNKLIESLDDMSNKEIRELKAERTKRKQISRRNDLNRIFVEYREHEDAIKNYNKDHGN